MPSGEGSLPHVHKFVFPEPDGSPTLMGVCIRCGERRTARVAFDAGLSGKAAVRAQEHSRRGYLASGAAMRRQKEAA